jgi:hypothetical protein
MVATGSDARYSMLSSSMYCITRRVNNQTGNLVVVSLVTQSTILCRSPNTHQRGETDVVAGILASMDSLYSMLYSQHPAANGSSHCRCCRRRFCASFRANCAMWRELSVRWAVGRRLSG